MDLGKLLFEMEFSERKEDGKNSDSKIIEVINFYQRGGNLSLEYSGKNNLSQKIGEAEFLESHSESLNALTLVHQTLFSVAETEKYFTRNSLAIKILNEFAIKYSEYLESKINFAYEIRMLGKEEILVEGFFKK